MLRRAKMSVATITANCMVRMTSTGHERGGKKKGNDI